MALTNDQEANMRLLSALMDGVDDAEEIRAFAALCLAGEHMSTPTYADGEYLRSIWFHKLGDCAEVVAAIDKRNDDRIVIRAITCADGPIVDIAVDTPSQALAIIRMVGGAV